jgi:hypothetical protein
MNEENRPLVAHEPVEFKKNLVEVQDFGKNYQSFHRNLWNIPYFNKENPKDVSM